MDDKDPIKKRVEVVPYRERVYCPKCDVELVPNGMCHPMSIPTFGHRCPKCGYTKYLTDHYPRIVYEDKIENGCNNEQ